MALLSLVMSVAISRHSKVRRVKTTEYVNKEEIRCLCRGRIMLEHLNHSRTALYLSIVVALINCVVCGLSVILRPQTIRDAIILCVLSLAIPGGLWLGSNFVRFAGSIFLVLWGGALLCPGVSSGAALGPGQLPLAFISGCSAALSLVPV